MERMVGEKRYKRRKPHIYLEELQDDEKKL